MAGSPVIDSQIEVLIVVWRHHGVVLVLRNGRWLTAVITWTPRFEVVKLTHLTETRATRDVRYFPIDQSLSVWLKRNEQRVLRESWTWMRLSQSLSSVCVIKILGCYKNSTFNYGFTIFWTLLFTKVCYTHAECRHDRPRPIKYAIEPETFRSHPMRKRCVGAAPH